MPSNDKIIRLILKMDNQVSSGANSAASSLSKLSKGLTDLGTKMTAGITLPIVGAGIAMFKTFADFESVIAELGARTGATADEMKKMSDYALEMGRNTAFSATEAAQALLELTSSGSSAAEAMEQLPHVLNLAAAGALELGEAADGLTDVMAAFNLEVKDSAMVADELAKAAGASSATVQDLLQGFGNAGPVFAMFGMNVNEAAAALAVLSEAGIKGAEAGTNLKSMLLNMSKDTAPVLGAWEKLGVSMYDAAGNMRDIDDIFKDINVAMKDMSMEEQNRLAADLAGSYGVVGFQALRAANGISDMQASMSAAAGAEEVAAARMNTLAGKFDNMMGSIEGLAIVMGGLAEGPLVWIIEGVTNAVNAFSEWAAANPMLAQTAMVILAIVAAIGPLLIIVGQLISAWAAVATVLPMVSGAFAALVTAISGPIGIAVALIAGLFLAWQTNFLGFRDLIMGFVNFFIEAFSIIFNGDYLGKFLQEDHPFIAFLFLIRKLVGPAIEDIKAFVSAIWNAWGGMINRAGEVFNQLGTIIQSRLSQLGNQMMQIGQLIVGGLINGIKSKAVDLLAYVFGLSKDLTAMIKSALGIHSPSKVMMDIGKNVVAGFHEGIDSMGGVGVNVPQTGGSGVSGQPSLGLAGASAGGGVVQNFYIYPKSTNVKEIAVEVSKEINKASKKKGAKGF